MLYKKVIILDAEIDRYYGLIKLRKINFDKTDSTYSSHSIDMFDLIKRLIFSEYNKDIYLLTITIKDTSFDERISIDMLNLLPKLENNILKIISKI